ncbi:hypothetical protein [Iodobacter fluviatilis]|uniref:Lipoprotein n=1 Tax=Iodobacter fluviatilis TaxID=537 RepID=A0A7G3GF96_9NEIS|nr:hypothetical protein [Iodobacter fluviatilis]QBC45849.1 hypothetical protein C1H71_20110 [Iodobacter fluviatilis]
MIKPIIKMLVLASLIAGLSACNDEKSNQETAEKVKEVAKEIIKDDFPVSDIEVEKMPNSQLRKYRQQVYEYQKKYANDSAKQQRAQEMLDRIKAIGANKTIETTEVKPAS